MVVRKRLLFWLLKAYIRKWAKTIIFSFLGGVIFFALILFVSRTLIKLIPVSRQEVIGVVGAYNIDTLPQEIVNDLSRGLTKISSDGSVRPDLAKSWKIKDDGKTYVFSLKEDVVFGDGKKFTANDVSYDFSNTSKKILSDKEISFTLKEKYAPFLITVSRPIFKKGLVGIGEYKIQDIELNGSFVKTLLLTSKKNKLDTKKYIFYPSEDALKIAFVMGEISVARGLTDDVFKNTSLEKYPNTTINKVPNTKELVTLFFNTKDPLVSDPKLRKAISYAMPETFLLGQRSSIPYPHDSMYANKKLLVEAYDPEHSKLLLESNNQNNIKITISTLEKYTPTAKILEKSLRDIGIKTYINVVDQVPRDFQIYLGDFRLPRDPDQYILWHSTSPNNITKFKNDRIDNLLETGRRTTDENKRKEIYQSFQKYFADESPAVFLYFPYKYNITRN